MTDNTKKSKKLGLTTKIFVGLILGAIVGILMHYVVPNGYVKEIGFSITICTSVISRNSNRESAYWYSVRGFSKFWVPSQITN